MEKALLIIFIVLFVGRMIIRYVLQHLNTNHLKVHGHKIPPIFQGMIDEATAKKAIHYSYDQSRLETKENLTGDIIELLVLFLILPVWVGRLAGTELHIIGQALIFFAVLGIISGVSALPFNLYSTFVLEKKYGFSTITWRIWLTDLAKSLIVSAILMAIIVSALMIFILCLPKSWWFWGWVFFTVFQMLLLWIYPVLIAPLFNKFEPIADNELKEKITALLKKAGLQAGGIYQMDEGKRSRHTNAYFTGIGKTKRIVLFDTLLASHTDEEIVSVLAHEIGHWKKRHIFKQLAFMICASLFIFYLIYQVVAWPPLYGAFGMAQSPVYAGLFLVSLYLAAAGFFLSPFSSAITRRFEREADRMAFDLTGTAQPMIGALKRLAKDNLSNLYPHPWYVWFYYSHPPLIERIEYLQTMDYKRRTVRSE